MTNRIGERLVLAGEVGASRARLGLFESNSSATGRGRLFGTQVVQPLELPQFADALGVYLDRLGVAAASLQAAGFAVDNSMVHAASPIDGPVWRFDRPSIEQVLQPAPVLLLEDCHALALGASQMDTVGLRSLRPSSVLADGARLVLSTGVTLQAAAVVRELDGSVPRWQVRDLQLGTAAWVPKDKLGQEVLVHLGSSDRVTVARMLGSEGLMPLHAVLRRRAGRLCIQPVTPARIASLAIEAEPLARAALLHFLAFLGDVLREGVEKTGAHGGVYLAGPLLARLGPLLVESPLLERLDGVGTAQPQRVPVPVWLVTDDSVALRGAELAARQAAGAVHQPLLPRRA